MNPPLSRTDKVLGAGTLLLLGLAGIWLGQPQQPFGGAGLHGGALIAATAYASDTLPAGLSEASAPPVFGPPPAEPVLDTLPTPAASEEEDAAPNLPKFEPWHVEPGADVPRPLTVRRYVGTIDGQPATAELHWQAAAWIGGSFYLHRGGPAYSLERGEKPTGTASFTVDTYPPVAGPSRWQLITQPGRPILKAVWHEGRRRRSVLMRESYVGALRYGIRSYLYSGGSDGRIQHDFLQLLAPTVVPARLRPLLNPGPQARLQQSYVARESLCEAYDRLAVRLNDFGLFSYQLAFESRQLDGMGGRNDDLTSFLFDLRRGRPLTVASQLQPDYEMPLRRLLARQLPAGFTKDFCLSSITSADTLLADLPELGMCLTGAGLEATYPGPQVCGPQTIHVAYRELRPLVRRGTPLDRMLRARGIN